MRRLLFLPVALLSLALPASASAWVPNVVCNDGSYALWPSGNPETQWRYSTGYPSQDVSSATATGALDAAFDQWSVPSCTSWNATRGPDTSSDPDADSSAHIIGWYETGWYSNWGSSTLAITLSQYSTWGDGSCEFSNVDMVFNGYQYDWLNGAPGWGQWNSADIQSVATHEAGHWLGLDHSTYPGSSLTASYLGGIDERDLTCDDTTGVCALYPASGVSCTSSRYCPCSEPCASGTCGGVPGDDDDATGDDDDDAVGECSGPALGANESEPNDWDGKDDVDWFQPDSGGDLTISGTISCGNNGEGWTADADWFVIDFPCVGDAEFRLEWNSDSDLDFLVWDTSSNEAFASNLDSGSDSPATDRASAGGRIFLLVACWEGQSTPYDMTIDWFPYGTSPGDDDDAADDDDATDDDDAADDDDATDDDDAADDDDDDDDGGGRSAYGCFGCDAAPASPSALGLLALGALLAGSLRRRRA